MFILAPLLALLLLGETPPVEASPVELWAGHHILRGMRHVPLHSDVLDEAENFVLAKVQRRVIASSCASTSVVSRASRSRA